MSLWDAQRRARERLEYAELAPAFWGSGQTSRAVPKRRQAGRSPNASRQRALRIDELRASIWSAWSLLPLSQPELKIIFHIHLVGLEVVDGLHLRGRGHSLKPRCRTPRI